MIRLFIPNVHHVRHLSLASNHFLIRITLHWRFESSTFGRHPAVKKLQKKQASRHWDHFVKHCLQFNRITKFNSNMNCSDHTWYTNKLHPPLGLWPLQQCKSFSSVLLSFSTKKSRTHLSFKVLWPQQQRRPVFGYKLKVSHSLHIQT